MKIELHPAFKKAFKKRILLNKRLVVKVDERASLFIRNSHHPSLKNHKLVGKQTEFRAFSITDNIRIVYFQLDENRALFLDIGTHDQVY